MSFAAYKMMHYPTAVDSCAAGFITHSRAESASQLNPTHTDADLDLDSSTEWRHRGLGPIPNLVVTCGNVLELYAVRVQEETPNPAGANPPRGGLMDGISGASLELVCHYRLHGRVESMAVLYVGAGGDSKRRESIVLAFKDAKISVLEFDDSIHGLRTSSMHCFEGPEWLHLRRGRESFARGPLVKIDPQGRCGGVLVYDLQMIILKAAQAGSALTGDDDAFGSRAAIAARIASSYIINLRDLDLKHVKDFIFVHDYIEPVMVILHEREPTWAGRVSWKHHTSMISALSISTTSKHPTLIWSIANLPHDSYKLLAVPSPIGGVLVIGANSIHYHSESSLCALALNSYAASGDSSQELPRASFSTELDAANSSWISNDVVLLSGKTGELLLLTLFYDGRVVQRLDLLKSKASVLTSDVTTIGNSLFFLGSRLGDSLLVQYTCVSGSSVLPSSLKEEVGDIEGDIPSAKRLRRPSSDTLQDMVSGEELSLSGSAPNNTESAQKTFSFAVRDSLINVGPLKDFSYGLRVNADANAMGISKQSNYELVCCSGHGKNGSLCVLRQSIRPEMITEVELPGCRGIWTVYHKNARGHNTPLDDEYHAYLIISLEARTMVLETADHLTEVTESVDYFVQGRTIAAGNLFGRCRVVQVYERGARILDGSFMTQDLNFGTSTSDGGPSSDSSIALHVSIADPFVLIRMTDGSIRLLVGDPSTCTVSVSTPSPFESLKKSVSACTLYQDKGPESWIRKTSTDAWLSSGISEPIDGADGGAHDLGDIYCVVCYESGDLEIFDVPNFSSVYFVEKFASGKAHLVDTVTWESPKDQLKVGGISSEEVASTGKKRSAQSLKVVELAMQRWSGRHSRPFLFGILTDGTILCYHAYMFEGPESTSKIEDSVSDQNSVGLSSASRLKNLRFVRASLDTYTREEVSTEMPCQRITMFKNISGYQGFFLSGSRPAWFMVFRERLRVHPQFCDGSIVAFTVLHNVNCNHGLIYVTSQGNLKICQLPSVSSYDNYWPVQKIPLKGTPHQVAYFAERNLYAVIVSVPVQKPLNHVLSSLVDQEVGHQIENHTLSSDDMQRTYTVDEFDVRIIEPSGGPWQIKATIPMQTSENALTVRLVSLYNTTTKENETLLAVGTAYAQGEDVAARGRVLLFSVVKNAEDSQSLVSEVYSKELKGAISALASLQGHLLIASGPKLILHKWNGTELNGIAFSDTPPLYVVSLNIVKNFILLGDINKSIYFLSWKEQGAQLSLLAKDFGSLECFSTEFLIDGSTLSLVVSDEQKNIQFLRDIGKLQVSTNWKVLDFPPLLCKPHYYLLQNLATELSQIFYYAPKMSESWKGQKLLPRAEFHVGAHVSRFMRLQMLSTSMDRSGTAPGSDKTNRFALLFGTLDGSLGYIAPLDELTFRRLQSLQKKLVDAVPHVAGLNPRSFRQFRSNGRAHRPGPESIVDCELLSQYEMLPLEEQVEIAQQVSTTRAQILSNLNDLSLGTSFL